MSSLSLAQLETVNPHTLTQTHTHSPLAASRELEHLINKENTNVQTCLNNSKSGYDRLLPMTYYWILLDCSSVVPAVFNSGLFSDYWCIFIYNWKCAQCPVHAQRVITGAHMFFILIKCETQLYKTADNIGKKHWLMSSALFVSYSCFCIIFSHQ